MTKNDRNEFQPVSALVKIGPMATFTVPRTRTLCELLSTFFVDASVLVFIFVPLDAVVQFGGRALTIRLIVATCVVASVFFAVGFILKVIGDEL